jgi:hypothetical protein
MDTNVDHRFKRTWDFFKVNVGALVVATLIILVCACFILPLPWMFLNLLGEIIDAVETGRAVRWQAVYERKGLFLASWGMAIVVGLAEGIGFALCIVPGVLLSLYWFHVPALVSRGRPVLSALGESGTLLQTRGGWADFLLNWLVLMVIHFVGSIVPFGFLATMPLSLIYLANCYLDDTGPSTVPATASPLG